jgi:hypothetical protein
MILLCEQLDRQPHNLTKVNMKRKKEKVFALIGFGFGFAAISCAACLFAKGSSIDPLEGRNVSTDELAITMFGFLLVAVVFCVLAWLSGD